MADTDQTADLTVEAPTVYVPPAVIQATLNEKTFALELRDAGLAGLPWYSFNADGVFFTDEATEAEKASIQAVVTAHNPSQPAPLPVPEVISDRQFAQILAIDGIITQDEALAWAARGELPSALEGAIVSLPDVGGVRFSARMLLSAATTYERSHPLVGTLGELLNRDEAALDDLWRRAAAL